MGSPLSPAAIARHRESIRTTKILERVQMHIFSETDPCTVNREAEGITPKPVKMTRDQLFAAQMLLRKVLPDLVATELSAAPGTAGGFVMFGQPVVGSTEDWTKENPPPA